MCYSCYIEAGKPAIVSEQTIEAAKLIKTVYQQQGCSVGGYAHIVLDDWNLDDGSIEFCIKEANKGEYDWVYEAGRQACLACLQALKTLTVEERYSALAIAEGFLQVS